MTLHGTNLRTILLLPAERRLICHLLWQWRGTSLVVPLHLDNPHNAGPLVWWRIHKTITSNGAWRCIFGPGSQSVPLLVFASLHTLLQHPLPTASSSSVTKSSSSSSLSSSLSAGGWQSSSPVPVLLFQCWLNALSSALAAVWPHVFVLSPTKGQTQKRRSCSVWAKGWSFSGCFYCHKNTGYERHPDRCKHALRLKQEQHARWDPPAGINSHHYESTPLMFARPPLEGLRSILHVISVWLWL